MAFQPTPLWNPVEVTPPWGWNPAATFLTAYTTAQEEKRAQREFEVAQELEQFLLPLKKQQAQLSLEKMNLEMEKTKGELTRQTLLTRMATDAYRNTNRGVNSGISGASNGGVGQGAAQADEDSFDAVPYQGADATGTGSSMPVSADEPTGFPQEAVGTRVAAASPPSSEPSQGMGDGYNFTLAGSPFEEGPTNPLYNLPTDNMGERIAMNDASTMGAGSPAGMAEVADQSSVPVEMSLTRQDPARGAVGTAPNMLGAENPLERMADAIPDEAPARPAQAEQPQPQSSGDPFYDWSTQTLAPWVQEYKKRSASLSQQNASGRLKAPAFYSEREQLNRKASEMLASALPKLDAEQSAQYEKLVQSKVEPLDALVQVSTSRPRARAGSGPTVDLARLEYSKAETAKVIQTLKDAGYDDTSPEVQQARGNLQALQRQYGQAVGSIKKPQEVFFQAESDLKLIPVYANTQRPLNGRTDFENLSSELQDTKLSAVREALANNDDWVVDLTSYERGADGKLTEEGLQRYQSDVTERRKKHGRVAIFDGQNISVAGPGAGDPKKPARPASATTASTETAAPVDGPDSAKAAAKALRDIGKATGMEDPPHIYAKKMYERYVGKPFTDAAWPWVRTFLQELKQPAGQ